MQEIPFYKMQGLGNDFMVVDATENSYSFTPELIKKMADRRYGIGFDQLLLLEKDSSKRADFFYRIFNADGSEVAQCGNGARCMARFIQKLGLSNKKEIALQTHSTLLKLAVQADGQVKVWLDPPHFAAAKIPMKMDQSEPPYELTIDNKKIKFYAANVGNPHAVLVDFPDGDLAWLGQKISTHPAFPEQTNVGFLKIASKDHIDLEVYERGSGMTLACGSGACAAAAVGRQQGWLAETVTVKQRGGTLIIRWPGEGQPLEMIGPAEFVYSGIYS